jgi:acylphosphatase
VSIHQNIYIFGKVQGVYYRGSAGEMAQALGLHGFVRNEPDGSVYAEVEGETEAVEKFVAWCRLGPPRARVTEVKAIAGEWRDFRGFEMKR